MQTKDSTFYSGRCGAVTNFDADTDFCKAKIGYHLQKQPKERTFEMAHLYSFPIVESKKNACFAHSFSVLKNLEKNNLLTRESIFDMKINTMNLEISNEAFFPAETIKISYNTKHLSCVRSLGKFSDEAGDIIALRTRPNEDKCAFIHFFEICNSSVNSMHLCDKINYILESADDNFIVEKHFENEFTIDYKILKTHVDLLNNIIKEIIDMAIVVARSVEARKKLEKNPKACNSKKSKDISLKMMACSPTSEEFVDILQKVRLGLNFMARLNPFVNHPNVPELLHHMIAPFSLITAVCGLDIVKTVKQPYLTSKAVWLIEHCFTTNELGFWRTLGESWNKPKCKYPSSEIFDDFYDPEFKLLQDKNYKNSKHNDSFDSFEGSDLSPECPAIILSNHYAKNDDEVTACAGSFVGILERQEEFYYITHADGRCGLIPSSKVYVINGITPEADCLFALCKQNLENLDIDQKFYASQNRWDCHSSTPSPSQIKEEKSVSRSSSKTSSKLNRYYNGYQTNTEELNSLSKNADTSSAKKPSSSSNKIKKIKTPRGQFSDISSQLKSSTSSTLLSDSKISTQTSNGDKECPFATIDASGECVKDEIISNDSFKSSKSVSTIHLTDEKGKTSSQDTQSIEQKKKTKKCCWCCTKKPSVEKDITTTECNINKKSPTISHTSSVKNLSTEKSHSKTSSSKSGIESKGTFSSKDHSKSNDSSKTHTSTSSQFSEITTDNSQQKMKEVNITTDAETSLKLQRPKSEEFDSIQRGISLCWEKSDVPQEECIKIEGIKLFRVRIKLMPCDENATDANSFGKATILMKSGNEISLKPNTKVCFPKGEQTSEKSSFKKSLCCSLQNDSKNESESMYKLKRVVCSPDSTVSSKKSDKASQKKKKNLTSSPKKEIQPKFTTKGGSKTTEKSAASICTDTGISICCDAHFDNRITKTASIKQKPISIVTEQVILPEEPCKDEITREKWQVDQTNIDEIYKNRHMTSEDIYKILRKYIPESQISTSNIADEANENKPKVSKTTLVDFYEKHICKDCGGVCHEQDTVDCEKDKTKCQTACHFSLSNINEPKPFEVSEGESSKHLESPHSSTLTASADEKTSQIQIPSFKEYCNDLKYSKSSTDPSFSPCVSENSTKHHIASSTESSSKSQEIKKNVFPTLLPSLPTDQDKQSTEISDTIPPPILSESSSAEEKITPSNTKSMDQATPPASTENKDVVSTAVDTNEASTLPKEETQPSIEIPVITITPIPSTSNLETVVPAVSVTSPEATVTATDATLTPMQPIYIPLENPESTITTVETSDTLTTPETTSFHSTEAVATTTDSNATSSPSANVSSTINAVSVPVAETHIVAAETTSTSVSAESTLTPISANTSPDAENLANDVTSPSSVEISPTADSTLLSTDVTTSTGESLGTPDTASLALGNTTSIINANETVIIPESNLTD